MIFTQERREERLKLYAAGLIDREIAKVQGVTRWSVYEWRHRHGLPSNDSPKIRFDYAGPAKQALKRERIRLIEAGWTDDSVAYHQQRSPGSIFDFRKRNGLAAGPGTLNDKPRIISYDAVVGDRYRADPSWSNWLEEMGATVW